MSRPTEPASGPAALAPFVHHRRIPWGGTDAARIAYTARFLDFAIEVIEAWFHDRLGQSFYKLNLDEGIGTPFVRIELNFRSSLTPRDLLETEVLLLRLGRSSLHIGVAGRAGERLAYEGRLVCAFVDVGSPRMRPIPVPEKYRAALQREAALAAARLQADSAVSDLRT